MEFKGTIIITDPCYFAKNNDWGTSFNYEDRVINQDCFSNYIWENTGIGDGSWMVVGVDNLMGQMELEDHVKEVLKNQSTYERDYSLNNKIKYEKSIKKDTILGRFGVDSGSFGVFYLDEVLNYCPSFLADIGEWCYTIIPDFIGNIDILGATTGSSYEDCREFVILGVGNKTFYSRS